MNRLRRWPQINDHLKNYDDLKNEDNLKKEDDLKNEDNLNNKDDHKKRGPQNGDDLNMKTALIWRWTQIEKPDLEDHPQARAYTTLVVLVFVYIPSEFPLHNQNPNPPQRGGT